MLYLHKYLQGGVSGSDSLLWPLFSLMIFGFRLIRFNNTVRLHHLEKSMFGARFLTLFLIEAEL